MACDQIWSWEREASFFLASLLYSVRSLQIQPQKMWGMTGLCLYLILSCAENHNVVDGVMDGEWWWWSIPCIIPVCPESCSWIHYALPCLVWVSWPSLTHTCLGGGRTRKCLHLSAICSENRLGLCSGSHPVSGFEDNTAHSNWAIYFNICKYGIESIKVVQPNLTYK